VKKKKGGLYGGHSKKLDGKDEKGGGEGAGNRRYRKGKKQTKDDRKMRKRRLTSTMGYNAKKKR